MAKRICTIPDCSKPQNARGWCSKHYQRWRTTGSTSPKTSEYATGSIEQRLNHYGWDVTPGGCWEWRGYRQSRGYGMLRVPDLGKQVLVHRLAHELWTGPIPDGLEVLHSCDNPPCMNPAHLSVGTHAKNMGEASERGRMPRGESAPAAKLSAADVSAIRAEYAAGGIKQADLGIRYRITDSAVSMIVNHKRWQHLK